MNIWEGVILFFAFQSLILAFLILFAKKGQKEAKRLWFVFMVMFAYQIFYCVLYWSKIHVALEQQLKFLYFIPLALYGPLFYSYNRMVLGRWKPKLSTLFLLASPFIFVMLFYGKFYFLPTHFREQFRTQQELADYLVVHPALMEGILVGSLLLFALISWRTYQKNRTPGMKHMKWVPLLNLLFLLFSLSWVLYLVLAELDVLTYKQDYVITIAMVVFVTVQAYLAHYKPDVLTNWKKLKNAKLFIKYGKTGMSNRVSLEYKEKLVHIMEQEKPFLDPELNLDILAHRLGISRHHASQVINQHFQKGFFDFINEYRIDEAKKILLKDKISGEFNVIEVLFAVGFNNKTSFYKAFKKFVGTSPSTYIEDQLETA